MSKTVVRKYNIMDFMAEENLLVPFCNLNGYKLSFSSREWVYAYLLTYKPSYCYYFSNDINYTVLCESTKGISFVGAGFNDYNSFNVVSQNDPLDVEFILSYFKELNRNIYFSSLHESHYINLLSNSLGNFRWLPSVSIRLTNEIIQQKSIYKNHKKIFNKLFFQRTYISNNEDFYDKLDKMLEQRGHNLNNLKDITYNSSMNEQFNAFIKAFCSKVDNKLKTLFIDSLSFENELVAIGLSIRINNSVLYYLRSTKRISNKYSFGLYLDCLAIERNIIESINIMDFGRGDESYKYRLGGVTYELANFNTVS